jgi:hypothetical protein
MMFEGLRIFLFGDPRPPSGADALPPAVREAHHRLRNTAMRMKQTARNIDSEANDVIEILSRDIKRRGDAEH